MTLGTVTSTAARAQPWRGPVALGIEVHDGDGNPVPGAEVRLEYAEVEPYSGPPPLTTDSAGRAEVFGLAEGLWRVQIDKPEFSRYLVVVRLDPKKKKVLITAGPLRDATAPPLEVEFVKSESRVARGDRPREETKKERKKRRQEERKKERKKGRERSGRISESEREEPEPPPQPPVRTVPEEERRPETPSPTPEPEPEPEPEPAPPSEPSAAVEPEPPSAPPEPVTETEEVEARPPEAATEEAGTREPEPEAEPEQAEPEQVEPEPAAESVPAPSAAPEPVRRRDRDAEKPVRRDEEAGPPPATSDVRSYESGTCSDCRPGEAATKALAMAGKSTGGGCPAGFVGDTETALETLAAAMNRHDYTGPLLVDGRVVALAPEPERSRAQQRLAPYIAPESPCQLLIVVLSPEVKFTGYRYEARQGSRGGDCLAGQDCPIGGARWPDHPTVQRTDEATFVYALFENRTDAERVAELTAYFDPTP